MERVLMVGGAGYIGGLTSDYLIRDGFEVTVYDNLLYEDRFLKDIPFIYGDIRDTEKLYNVSRDFDIIVLMAALVGDPACSVDPILTDEINYQAIKNFCEAVDPGKHLVFMSTCHDDETLCLTNNGIKKYYEINKTDKVFTYNVETGNVEWKGIKNIIIKDYDGDLINFEGRRVSFNVTPDHRMLVKTPVSKKILYRTAEEIENLADVHFINETGWDGAKKDIYVINDGNKSILMETNDLFYISGLFIGDGYTTYSEKKVKNVSGFSKKELNNIKNEYGQFTMVRNKIAPKTTSLCKSFNTCFCLPKTDPSRNILINILNKYDIKYWTNDMLIGISSELLFNFFGQFGKGAKNKYIPKWMLEYDKHYLQYLFDGLIHSDGNHSSYRKGVKPQLHTVSDQLLTDVLELGHKINYNVTFRKRHCESFIGERKITGDAYVICFSTSNKTLPRESIKRNKYVGKVWCLEVEDNSNFMVIRHGKTNFAGNCSVYGAQDGLLNENSNTNPLSSYAETKLKSEKCILQKNGTIFRLGTVFGLGDTYSRLRMDLVVNVLTMKAVRNAEITINGGDQWRPIIAVKDIAEYVVEACKRKYIGVFILSKENVIIRELGERVSALIPGTKVNYTDISFQDARNYKVDNTKSTRVFEYVAKVSVEEEVERMVKIFEENRVDNPEDKVYHNGAFLKNKKELNQLI